MRPARWPQVWADATADLGLDPSASVLLVGQRKTWWRIFLPGLWFSGLRVLALGKDEILVFHAGMSLIRRHAGPPIWRGSVEALSAAVTSDRRDLVELAVPRSGKPEIIVVAGRENCDDLRHALGHHI